MDSDYDDANRAFLQAFMARSSMTLEEAQPVLAAILSTHGRFICEDTDWYYQRNVLTDRI